MFKHIFVANRGEIACRIIKAIHDIGAKAILGYSIADKDAKYLQLADETICIGDSNSKSSYLNQDAILQAAMQTNCQALHPGYGFLSENYIFATRCNQQKIKFIGPEPKHLHLTGNKLLAKKTAHKILPSILGSYKTITSLQDVINYAHKYGYPFLLKAILGGGGKGIKLITNKDQLESSFLSARNEADKSFNSNNLYIEKYIYPTRHIEFQILADKYQNIIILGERDCSIQKNNQKLLEEAPAINFPNNIREVINAKIIKLFKKIKFIGAATVEFLLDTNNNIYFLEINPRLQVEHPITELITNIDIVKYQILIANGYKLDISQQDIIIRGHAIECRINAENPNNNFLPSPGIIKTLKLPNNNINGPLRIDTHVNTGYKIPSFYDSMIAKIISFGKNRKTAIDIMNNALNDIYIENIITTKTLHQNIINNKNFIHGNYNSSFLKTNFNI